MMVEADEFVSDLLARIVQNIKPSKAAIFSGPGFPMTDSFGVETDASELNLEFIEKVIESGGPVSDKIQKRQLAVPYKDLQGEILGVMYVEIAAPRRLKFRDLAILQGLGRQMVERYWKAGDEAEPDSEQKAKSEIDQEILDDVSRYARSTLSIVSSVLKPQRVIILVRLEGEPRIIASRGFGEPGELSEVPFSLELANTLWQAGETFHLRDALNHDEYGSFSGVAENSIRSVCVCPLNKLDGEDRGLIYLDSCEDAAEFLTAEVSILQRLGLALEKDLAKVLGPEPDHSDILSAAPSAIDDDYTLPDATEVTSAPQDQLAAFEPDEAEESESVEPTIELDLQIEDKPLSPEEYVQAFELAAVEEAFPIDDSVEEEDDPPPTVELYDDDPIETVSDPLDHYADSLPAGETQTEFEADESDVVTLTLPEVVSQEDGPLEELDFEEQQDTAAEPTVEESIVESVRALPVDATVEILPNIAALALAGVRANLSDEAEVSDETEAEAAEPEAVEAEPEPEAEPEQPLEAPTDEPQEDEDESESDSAPTSAESEALAEPEVESPTSSDPPEPDAVGEQAEREEELDDEELIEELASGDDDDGPVEEPVSGDEDGPGATEEPDSEFAAEEPELVEPEPISEPAAEKPENVEPESEPEPELVEPEPEPERVPLEDMPKSAPQSAQPPEQPVETHLQAAKPSKVEKVKAKEASVESEAQVKALVSDIKKSLEPVAPAKSASFMERLRWVFSPKAVPVGGEYSHVHISGTVVLEGEWKDDTPIEVTLHFPTHNMRVVLELGPKDKEYTYHGRFIGESPVWFELKLEKRGYFPVKLSRVTFVQGDGEPSARVGEITLLERDE